MIDKNVVHKINDSVISSVKTKKNFITRSFLYIKKYLEDSGYIYASPKSMGWGEWQDWEENTKTLYPIQYWLRVDVPLTFRILNARAQDKLYTLKKYFCPPNALVIKAVKEGNDITGLVVDVNFALILQFREEMKNGIVYWESDEGHKKFREWFDEAVNWITVERPAMHKALDNAYPKENIFSSKCQETETYEALYGEVNRIEAAIADTDTQVIHKLAEYRNYMWT